MSSNRKQTYADEAVVFEVMSPYVSTLTCSFKKGEHVEGSAYPGAEGLVYLHQGNNKAAATLREVRPLTAAALQLLDVVPLRYFDEHGDPA